MAEQKLVVTVSTKAGGELGIKISFDPALAGQRSDAHAAMTEDEKYLQRYAEHLAVGILEAIKKT